MLEILKKLSGGDLRSIGRANEVAHEVEKNPALFEELFKCLYENDPIIRMRSADAIEKASKNEPELLSGYTSKVIALIESSVQQEVCWHMAQIAPRLKHTDDEEGRIIKGLKKYLLHKSKIVRVSAMDSLVEFSEKNKTMLDEVLGIIEEQIALGSPAVRSRGRKLLQRIKRNQ